MFEAWIGLGANQGDAIATLKKARDLLGVLSHQKLVSSSLYESDPWGGIDQGVFINQVVRIQVSHEQMTHFINTIFNLDWINLRDDRALPIMPTDTHSDLSWSLWAERLLNILLMIERSLGRKREDEQVRWGPRVIDLDLLEMTSNTMPNRGFQSSTLVLPHPRLHLRNFVLVPWAEVAPQFKIATLGRSVDELMHLCPDQHQVRRIMTPPDV